MIQREHKGEHQKIKQFIDRVRAELVDNIERVRDTMMGVIKAALNAKMRDEAMVADKIRSRLDRFRENFNYNDPIVKIYTMEEKRLLKEKGRLKGIVVLLELFLIEVMYMRKLSERALWTASNATEGGLSSLSELLDKVSYKLLVYEKSLERYEDYLKTSVGLESKRALKKQMMDYFSNDELEEVARLVREEGLDELERQYLGEEEMVSILPPKDMLLTLDPELFNEALADEPDEPEPAISEWVSPGEETEETEESEVESYDEEDFLVFIDPLPYVQMDEEKDVAPEEEAGVPLITPEAYPEESPSETEVLPSADAASTIETRAVESNIENFIKKTTGKVGMVDDIRTFVLERSNKIKQEGDNSFVPLAKIYEELVMAHPNWAIKPKKLLRVMQDLEKNGIIASVRKLDTGFFIVQFLPVELTQDPQAILEIAKDRGFLTKEDVMKELNWPEFRTDAALEFMEARGIAKTDVTFMEGKRYFFLGN